MHRPVDVVQQVEGLADQVEALAQEALLDLALAAREHVVRVRSLRRDAHASALTTPTRHCIDVKIVA